MKASPKLPRLVALTSQKGGVGKTTVSLLVAAAAGRAIRGVPSDADPEFRGVGARFKKEGIRHVLYIDADIAGTEVAWLADAEFKKGSLGTKGSLVDALRYSPVLPNEDLPSGQTLPEWVWKELLVHMPSASQAHEGTGTFPFAVMTTFGYDMSLDRGRRNQIARVLEEGGALIQYRLRELLRALACAPDGKASFVVMDCPAFDVGFAQVCREAIQSEQGRVLGVVTPDIRDLFDEINSSRNTASDKSESRQRRTAARRPPRGASRDLIFNQGNEEEVLRAMARANNSSWDFPRPLASISYSDTLRACTRDFGGFVVEQPSSMKTTLRDDDAPYARQADQLLVRLCRN